MLRPRGSSSSCYETNLGPTVTHTNPLGRAFCQPVSALGRAHDEPKPKAGPEAAGPATGSHATSHPHPAAKGGGSDPSPRTTGSRERAGMTRSEDSCVHGFAIVCVLRSQLLYIQYSTCRGATPGVHRNAEWELLSSRGMTVVYRSMRVKRLARPSMLLPSFPSQLDLSRPGTVPVRRKEWQLGESRSRSSSMMRQKLQGWGSGRGQALSGSVALTMSPIAILVLVFSSGCLFYSVKSHLLPTDNIDYDTGAKSFYIANDSFYKDGSPFRILGGDLHYFRVHPQYWEDRLQRAKALGLNAIQTYVPWNLHQPQPEKLNFEDGANLEGYLKLVQKLGMLVMLRIGPYICAEWDFGGFPAWLLSVRPELSLRTSDPQYLKLVDAWWDVLLPKIVPYLYCHQGPVIMVQIENEYGSFGADRSYMEHLAAKVRAVLGEEIILYTTDGAVSKNLEHGSLEGSGVYTAVDFPTEWDPATAFALQKQYNAQGNSPSLSSEFYTGWLTHWGEQLAQTDPEYTAAALDRILYLNASVVLYMLHGGTNFGFTSGSNTGSSVRDFLPDITSYDYDAPIGEAGDIDNPKFQALKAVLGRYILESPPSPPPLPMRKAFGPLQLHKLSSLFHILEYISTDPSGLHMDQPSSMESVHQISGFILYRTNLPSHAKAGSKISISKVHDRAQVFISGLVEGDETTSTRYLHVGTLERWSSDTLWLPSNVAVPGLQLDILVENMGRVNYGPFVYDPKGILSAVLLDGTPILDWISFSIPLDSIPPSVAERVSDRKTERTSRALTENSGEGKWTDGPTFYRGQLSVEKPADTFLSVVGWSKGVAFLNGFNLGRYWPVKGPQCSYYIPAPLFYAGDNDLILLELDDPSTDLWVNFTEAPDYSCHGGVRSV